MKPSAALLLALCAALLAGCAAGIQMSRTTPARLSDRVAEGRSPDLHTANPFGYWLWREDDGTWHLRTTAERQHRFQGRIRATVAGSIHALAGVNLFPGGRRRMADSLRMSGDDIVFDFLTAQGLTGLDFQLVGKSDLEFDLRIDGDADAGKIFLGKRQLSPDKAHFVLSQ